MSRLPGLLLAASLVFVATLASATQYRRPFDAAINLGYGYDHNGTAAGCLDHGCGSKCYNGHKGNDYPLPYGTNVVAAAKGTVEVVSQGCADVGSLTNTCGGGFGNYVRIAHADGKRSYYAHLKNGSAKVSVGQSVACGQVIGQSASSGRSSGNHLHFESRVSNVSRDPYSGSCGHSSSHWVSQGSYGTRPGVECETTCACTAGQTQTENCGNCGKRSRTCGSNCQWGSWSSCSGQGECAAGAKQSETCGDCGTRTRTCSSSCKWGAFAGCEGPDPEGGKQSCATGLLGVCAEGRMRCEAGTLACRALKDPTPETCSGVDDDCDGEVDEGMPQTLGAPPPEWAAELVDLTHPDTLSSGALGKVTIDFRNVGQRPWKAGEPQLTSLDAHEGKTLELIVPDTWAGVVASPDSETPVGAVARFGFSVQATAGLGEMSHTFRLRTTDGAPLSCPSPQATVTVRGSGGSVLGGGGADAGIDGPKSSSTTLEPLDEGCACRAAGRAPGPGSAHWGWLLLGLALPVVRRASRPLL